MERYLKNVVTMERYLKNVVTMERYLKKRWQENISPI